MIASKFNKIILLILAYLITIPQIEMHAQQLEIITNERKQVEKDIKNIDKLLKSIEGNQKAGLQELTLIKKKIDSRKQVLLTIDKQIELLSAELERKQEAIDILQAELKNIQNSYSGTLKYYYTIRNKDNWMMYIMASESVSQAYKRMKYFREILFLLQAQANIIVSKTNKLNEEITEMARKQQMLQDNIGDKRKEVDILVSEEKQSQTVLSELKRKEQQLKKQLAEKQKSYDQLSSSLREFFQSEEGRNISLSSNDMKLLTESFEANKGFLPWPAMGTVVSSFGKHNHSVYKDVKLPENNGIDIQTPLDAEVYSIFTGKVSRINILPKTGEKVIIIRHGQYITIYFRVNEIFVKVGDEVKPRQKIATVANSSEGSILHFEIQKDINKGGITTPLNPQNWIIR